MQLHHRHLDEAEFCFGVFEAALDAPHYDLVSLARGPERRLWTHVDGLAILGAKRCSQLLSPLLADPDVPPQRLGAAGLALAQLAYLGVSSKSGRDPLASLRPRETAPSPRSQWTRLLISLASLEGDQRAALHRALCLGARPAFSEWLVEQSAVRNRGALAAQLQLLASLRCAPPRLAEHLGHRDPQVVRAAARAARLSREPAVLERLRPLAVAKDPLLSRAAVESALVHYIPGSWASALYWAFTDAPSPFRRRALIWIAMLGDLEVHGWLIAGLQDEARRANTLWALGFCGRPAALEAALPWLEHEQHGPLAAEVVSAIAGLPFDAPGCWRRRPPPVAGETLPPLAHDTLDGDLIPKAEEALPLPIPDAVRAWWHARREHFDPKLRYLGGRAMTPAVLVRALEHGSMRRAHVHALELTIRSGGHLQLRTRQSPLALRRDLAALPSLELLNLQRGLRKN